MTRRRNGDVAKHRPVPQIFASAERLEVGTCFQIQAQTRPASPNSCCSQSHYNAFVPLHPVLLSPAPHGGFNAVEMVIMFIQLHVPCPVRRILSSLGDSFGATAIAAPTSVTWWYLMITVMESSSMTIALTEGHPSETFRMASS